MAFFGRKKAKEVTGNPQNHARPQEVNLRQCSVAERADLPSSLDPAFPQLCECDLELLQRFRRHCMTASSLVPSGR